MPFVSRTRAIFRSAEFGFLGVIVDTRVQTPRFCGAPWSAGVFVFSRLDVRPLRISWLTVGMRGRLLPSCKSERCTGQRRYKTTAGAGENPARPGEIVAKGRALRPSPRAAQMARDRPHLQESPIPTKVSRGAFP